MSSRPGADGAAGAVAEGVRSVLVGLPGRRHPELFVATVLILGITAVLAKAVSTTAAWVTMPILVTGALATSVWRARR